MNTQNTEEYELSETGWAVLTYMYCTAHGKRNCKRAFILLTIVLVLTFAILAMFPSQWNVAFAPAVAGIQ